MFFILYRYLDIFAKVETIANPRQSWCGLSADAGQLPSGRPRQRARGKSTI